MPIESEPVVIASLENDLVVGPLSNCSEESFQSAEDWSLDAHEYSSLSSKVPVVTYYSEAAISSLFEFCPEILSLDDSSFLDCCAGPAILTMALITVLGADKASNINITVTDYAGGMVGEAQSLIREVLPYHDKVSCEVMDVQEMTLASDSIDVVGCMFGYFVPDRMKAFTEIRRVSKSSGKCVISTWKSNGFIYLVDDFLRYLRKVPKGEKSQVFKDAHILSVQTDLESELKQAGFIDIKIEEKRHIFETPLTRDVTHAAFANPMVKHYFEEYSEEVLFEEWLSFLQGSDVRCMVDFVRNVALVDYVAYICVCNK